jgi:hypothetical protein
MTRRMKDGDVTGIKQDKFRHSRFEFEERASDFGGASESGPNTLGGVFNENRGRRGDAPGKYRTESAFENGRLYNWKNRQGWEPHFYHGYDKGNRNHGGALIGHDGEHRGKGPRGYKRSDSSIYEDVCETLALSPNVDASEIEVTVQDACVYLKGTVADRGTKRAAELEIENISGVQDVQNMLRIAPRNQDLH